MRGLGIWLVIFAVGSYVLPMLGVQFVILFWIYNWGPTTAMVIQGSMLALGIALIVGGSLRGRAGRAPTTPG